MVRPRTLGTTLEKTTIFIFVVAASEILALFLIRGIWLREDYRVMKVLMTVVALIPVIGPLGVLWTLGFPSVRNRAFQNKSSSTIPTLPTLEVFDRWRHVLDEKNEAKKKQAAKNLLDEYHDR